MDLQSERTGTAGVVFRLGPALFLIPAMLIWATICLMLTKQEGDSWWRTYPIMGALALAVVWHAALILTEKRRLTYVVYAVLHLPMFYALYVFAMILATRSPL